MRESLASILQYSGRAAEADSVFRTAVARYEVSLGESSEETAIALSNHARLLQERAKLDEAEATMRKSLDVTARALGPSSLDYGWRLAALGQILNDMGDLEEAEKVTLQACEIVRDAVGEHHRRFARVLLYLGLIYRKEGRLLESECAYRRCMALQDELYDPEDFAITLSLNNLGLLRYHSGNLVAAESLLRECLARRLSSGDDVATGLNNLAVVLQAAGRLPEARTLLEEALAIRRKALGPDHWLTVLTLANLSEATRNQGRLEEAERLAEESLAAYRRLFGDDHEDTAVSLIRVAVVRSLRGDTDGALEMANEGVATLKRALGERHPRVGTGLNSAALVARLCGERSECERLLAEAGVVFESARARLDSEARIEFGPSPYSRLAGVRLELGKGDEAWAALERYLGRSTVDALVASRSRILSPEEMAREDSLRVALDSAEQRVAALTKAALSDPSAGMPELEAARNRVLQLEVAWSECRLDLVDRHPELAAQPFELDRVQACLGPRTAIVGWLDAAWTADDVETWGYVIRNEGPVRWERLAAPEDSIAVWQRRIRGAFRDPGGVDAERLCLQLHAARFAPLERHLDGVENLVVVVSDLMRGVPLEALGDGRTLVGDRFAISYAPSATAYAWFREHEGASGGAAPGLFVGDPVFPSGADPVPDREPAGRQSAGLATAAIRMQLFRSGVTGSASALDSLPPLPATRQEVEECSGLFPGSDILVGPAATEQAVSGRATAGTLARYRVLHFATHALANDERPEESALVLTRAGLPDPIEAALSGERVYDGLVTAREILEEWTLDADLVVLSGCETALGREVSGEGYVGLASALLRVGARSLLVSLWPVEDRSTSLLMRRFYENWTGSYGDERAGMTGAAMSKTQALGEAKRWLRSLRGPTGVPVYASPFFWAGFILVGSP